MKIVIIAGGKGTRIASVNSEIPKAMIPVDGKPVLERQLEMAISQGFREFIFIIGHLGNVISDYFGDGSRWNIQISYFHEKEPLGTAGALSLLKDSLKEDFFVFYGDTIMDVDLGHMLDFHKSTASDATLLIHPNDHPYDSDIVLTDSAGNISRFCLKPHPEDFISRNLVNASLFIFTPKVLEVIEPGIKSHIEKDILPRCLTMGMKLSGYLSAEYIKDMGTPERYAEVCRDFMSGKVKRMNRSKARPALFLDRDGVIIKEIGWLNSVEQVELIDGAAEGIRMANTAGWLTIVVTNQPVIARGECTWEELDRINAKMETLLGREHVYLNDIYVCPHHPEKGFPGEVPQYKIECECRKPKPGMLLKAAAEWNIDLSHSVMVGDSVRDVQAGERAGVMKSVLLASNSPGALPEALKEFFKPDS